MTQAFETMLHDIKQAEKTGKEAGFSASRPTSAASVEVSCHAQSLHALNIYVHVAYLDAWSVWKLVPFVFFSFF
jgi:hypothetical protein